MTEKKEFLNLSCEASFIGEISISSLMLTNMLINTNQQINKEYVADLANSYIKWGRRFNIRPDFSWAQMCLETNFLKFTGLAKLEWNNFCNLGIIKKKADYAYLAFDTPELGVIAHYAHLAWYLYQDHINEYCDLKYDPRHFKVNGKEHMNVGYKLNSLDGIWNSDKKYSIKISNYANKIYDLIAEGRNYKKRKNIFKVIKNSLIDLVNIRKSEKEWKYIAIHHSATLKGNVNEFREYHRIYREFWEVAYNYVICNGLGGSDGEIQKGRSLEIGGAHVKGYNNVAIGVNLVGWFDNYIIDYKNKVKIPNPGFKNPTNKQWESLINLVKDLMIEYGIPIENIRGHREFPNVYKSCPGYNFNMDEFRAIIK